MPRQTGMPDAIAAMGAAVDGVAGWETRGSSSFNPGCVVCHWTAGPRSAHGRPSLNVVTHGRPGIPGPLCNVYLDRAGIAVMVAAGRANHAGTGGFAGLSGNSRAFGIEAESAGDGDWTDAQKRAYPRVVAGLLRLIGQNEGRACGHNEWAPSRKIDIRDWDMTAMRRQVAAALAPTAPPTPAIPVAPPAPTVLEDDVRIIRNETNGACIIVSGGNHIPVLGDGSYPKLLGSGVPVSNVTPAQFDLFLKGFPRA